MKRLFHLLLFTLLTLTFVDVSFAQPERSTAKVGTTAAQFLKIGPGSRSIAMGGAVTALSDDIHSAYWNPARMVYNAGNGEAAFSHAEWLADISYDFAAASLHLVGYGTLFMTVTTLGVPEDIVRTMDFPEGDGRVWDARSLAIGIGFARMLTDKFAIGFHAKYIRESIWNTNASGVAIDVGTSYITPFNDMVIAASISNFGSKMQMDGRDILFNFDPNGNLSTGPNNVLSKYEMGKFDLPLSFRLGLAMDLHKSRYFRATAAVDAVHPNDNTEYVNSGLELAYDEMMFVRVGYKSLFLRDTEQGLTFGGGLKYRINDQLGLSVNYGWADYGRLKNVQFLDFGVNF